ncbi:hypothetical protein [Streptomyces sp. B6B3]|uniref:hypothetical protein n=1 Tax=Streptomyces sp. B6B3 TaxID=3153570 RepID=UPI00325E0022
MTTWTNPTGPEDSPLEAELRLLLSGRADGLPAESTPYDTILRKGRVARRRRTIALCSGAAVLAAAGPVAAFGLQPGGSESIPPAAVGSSEAGVGSSAGTGSDGPTGPSDPERQLLDGVTLEQATETLERCLSDESPLEDPGVDVDDMRILLAWVAQGDENRGEGPIREVLAVSDDAEPVRIVCSEGPDGWPGIQSGPVVHSDDDLPVSPDSNARRHYSPILEEWDVPFRWADFGLVKPEVERVTVTYAGVTEEAVVEEGHFVAAGIAEEQPDANPVIVGYDADGEVVYDSREDPTYTQDQ